MHQTFSFFDDVELVGLEVAKYVYAPSYPFHFDLVDMSFVTQPKMQSLSEVALIASSTMGFIDLLQATCSHLHSRPDAVPVAGGSLQVNLQPVVACDGVIPDECRGTPRIQDHGINISVIVEVIECGTATAMHWVESVARLF